MVNREETNAFAKHLENDDPDPAGGRVGAAGGARRPLRGRGVYV